jgi:hypothetical protein
MEGLNEEVFRIRYRGPLGQGMLKLNFVTKSWADIAKDLQKKENWKDKS